MLLILSTCGIVNFGNMIVVINIIRVTILTITIITIIIMTISHRRDSIMFVTKKVITLISI